MAGKECTEGEKAVIEAYEHMMVAIDKTFMRNIQRQTFICSMDCCNNPNLIYRDLQACFDNCSIPPMNIHKYVNAATQNLKAESKVCLVKCVNTKTGNAYDWNTHNLRALFPGEYDDCASDCYKELAVGIKALEEKMVGAKNIQEEVCPSTEK